MEGDAPQVPPRQKLQPEVQNILQVPQPSTGSQETVEPVVSQKQKGL